MRNETIVHLEITKPVWHLSSPLRELLNGRMCRCIVNQAEWQSFVPDEYVLPVQWIIIGTDDKSENSAKTVSVRAKSLSMRISLYFFQPLNNFNN